MSAGLKEIVIPCNATGKLQNIKHRMFFKIKLISFKFAQSFFGKTIDTILILVLKESLW